MPIYEEFREIPLYDLLLGVDLLGRVVPRDLREPLFPTILRFLRVPRGYAYLAILAIVARVYNNLLLSSFTVRRLTLGAIEYPLSRFTYSVGI